MANEYTPRGDAEFNAWLANFVTYANANLAGVGLVLDTPRFAVRNPLLRNVVRDTMRRVKGMTPVTPRRRPGTRSTRPTSPPRPPRTSPQRGDGL
jgi:hypothetical protein